MANAADIQEWEREWRQSRQARDFFGVRAPPAPAPPRSRSCLPAGALTCDAAGCSGARSARARLGGGPP